jgi:hypothetical protein
MQPAQHANPINMADTVYFMGDLFFPLRAGRVFSGLRAALS